MHKDLFQEAMRFKLCPAVERTIEAPHALVHVKVAKKRHVSAPYVSMVTRQSMLESMLAQHGSEGRLELEGCYSRVRDPDDLAEALHCQEHPDYLACKDARIGDKLRALASIVYHADSQARFMSQQGARRAHLQVLAQEKQISARVIRDRNGPPRQHANLDELMSKIALEHFRLSVTVEQLGTRHIHGV